MMGQETGYEVTFLFGSKFRYALSLFLFVISFFVGLSVFVDLNRIYVIVFALIMLPFLIISIRSRIEKHKLEILHDKLVIGPITIEKEETLEIVTYSPITIYFHLNKPNAKRGKRIEAIQVNSKDAQVVLANIYKWADENDIELVKN